MGSPVITDPRVRRQVALNLRKLLERHQWSGAELARRTRVSQKHINNIVRERTGCSVETLFELAKPFKMPAWQLLVPGLPNYGASPIALEKIVAAYLRGDDNYRQVAERLADTATAA